MFQSRKYRCDPRPPTGTTALRHGVANIHPPNQLGILISNIHLPNFWIGEKQTSSEECEGTNVMKIVGRNSGMFLEQTSKQGKAALVGTVMGEIRSPNESTQSLTSLLKSWENSSIHPSLAILSLFCRKQEGK